jgi:hypothetical protein
MNFGAFVTSSAASLRAGQTVGVAHDGSSSRDASTPLAVREPQRDRNESFCWSHCTITSRRSRIGELALPHS